MKKAIDLLDAAEEAALNGSRSTAVSCIEEALAELKAKPRWYTLEQWEKRMGKPWPANWPVFFECGENTNEYHVGILRTVMQERVLKICRIFVFTEAGPPPKDWSPEHGE